MLAFSLPGFGLPVLRTMLTLEFLLLAIGAVLAIWLGPLKAADESAIIATGMVLVAALAIQNAASRIHLASAPPASIAPVTPRRLSSRMKWRVELTWYSNGSFGPLASVA